MFGREYDYSLIKTSSKEALLRSAITVAGNDIKKASEICDYFIKQLPNMPEREPAPITAMDQLEAFAGKVSAWSEKHPDVTNGISTILMQVLRNTKFGAFLPTATEAAAEIVKPAPIV